MILGQDDKPPLDELMHYGVKGMKWGVRKARTGKLMSKAAQLDRVANGTGSIRDKAYAVRSSTPIGLARGGLKKNAARRSANYKGQVDRLANHHAKLRDILKAYGGTSLLDLARATRD